MNNARLINTFNSYNSSTAHIKTQNCQIIANIGYVNIESRIHD